MPVYPNHENLLTVLTSLNGELTPREKALAFLAYSLGGVDMLKYSENAAEFSDLKDGFISLTRGMKHKQDQG